MKIIFDLDGTLIDVSTRHHRVYEECVVEVGGQPLEKTKYWGLKKAKITWPDILNQSAIDMNKHQDFMELFISKIESPTYLNLDKVIPGTFEVLESVTKKYRCTLLSLRRDRDNLLNELEVLGLTQYFEEIISGHTESEGYILKTDILKRISKTENIVVVGDTEADIKAAHEVGARSIAVLSGIRNRQVLVSLEPDFIIENINELEGCLNKI